jgi:hypothetical protein
METFHDAEGGRRGPSVVLPGQRAFKPAIEESFLERKTTADPSSATPTRKTRGKAPTLVPHKCTLAELKERMVLGEDIAAPNGKVLLGRGTALSLRMIGRLREVVADREFVWILKEE